MSGAARISAAEVRARLAGGGEFALIDAREHGQSAEGRPFFAVNLPYSRLEIEAARLIPRRATPITLLDGGDGLADRAAARLAALGYADVTALEGGAPGWAAAGHGLFRGENLPSKTLGELVEHELHTPSLTAAELAARRAAGENIVLLDGRTPEEHARFTVPGSVSCPNGELALRAPALMQPGATVVVCCAGRTRGVVGAQTLKDFGFGGTVLALENGSQGWELAGFQREIGADRKAPAPITPEMRAEAKRRAEDLRRRFDLPRADMESLERWRRDPMRTTLLFDVRTEAEYRAATVPGAIHAPGGQLTQATDRWIGPRGARVVVWDDCAARAAFAALWLRRMGHDAAMLDAEAQVTPHPPEPQTEAPAVIDAAALAEARRGGARLLDLRSSAAYRACHVDGALWSIRPRLERLSGLAGARVVVMAAEPGVAALAAADLRDLGAADVLIHTGGPEDWRRAGLETTTTPDDPPDSERIDHLFFVAERHAGDLDHARAYLAWEKALPSQLDAAERAMFRLDGH